MGVATDERQSDPFVVATKWALGRRLAEAWEVETRDDARALARKSHRERMDEGMTREQAFAKAFHTVVTEMNVRIAATPLFLEVRANGGWVKAYIPLSKNMMLRARRVMRWNGELALSKEYNLVCRLSS